jgi:hypothetical protein
MTTPYHDDEASPFDEHGILKEGRSATVSMSTRDGGDHQRQLRRIDASGDPLGLHRPGFRVPARNDAMLQDALDDAAKARAAWLDELCNAWRSPSKEAS